MDKTVTILVVEDDANDRVEIERTLRDMNISNPLRFADDGIVALDILRGANNEDKIEKPFWIFLDLKMPRLDGHGFLKELREDPTISDAVVFVFTSSDADEDIKTADQYGVAGFILKSDMRGSFSEAANLAGFSWSLVKSD